MRAEEAELLGLEALAWLAGDAALLPAFMGASGLSPADLGARAGEPEVLGAVLDFLLQDDARVLAFAAAAGRPPEAAAAARRALPGGGETHWT